MKGGRYVHKDIIKRRLKEKGVLYKEKEAIEEIYNLTDILMETILDEIVRLYNFEFKKYNRKMLAKSTVELAFENILLQRWSKNE